MVGRGATGLHSSGRVLSRHDPVGEVMSVAPRAIMGIGAALAVIVYAGVAPRSAYGEDVEDTSSRVFSCVSETRAFIEEHSAGEIRAERDRWLTVRVEPGEPAVVTAHRSCVVAE